MLYPIATASYTMTMSLGLPYDAPFQDAMQYYQYKNNYIQISILIPYSVPSGYALKIKLNSAVATFSLGSAYINIQTSSYTPVYQYDAVSSSYIVITGMGPIVIGTTLKVTANVYINTNSLFGVNTYIDTPEIISAFTSSSYLYQGLIEGSGVASSTFFNNFYDSTFG